MSGCNHGCVDTVPDMTIAKKTLRTAGNVIVPRSTRKAPNQKQSAYDLLKNKQVHNESQCTRQCELKRTLTS